VISAIHLDEKFGRFTERWQPNIIAAANGQEVKLVKVQGEFPWHHHDDDPRRRIHRADRCGALCEPFGKRAADLTGGQTGKTHPVEGARISGATVPDIVRARVLGGAKSTIRVFRARPPTIVETQASLVCI